MNNAGEGMRQLHEKLKAKYGDITPEKIGSDPGWWPDESMLYHSDTHDDREGQHDCPVCLGAGWLYKVGEDGQPIIGHTHECSCRRTMAQAIRERVYLDMCRLPAKAPRYRLDLFKVVASRGNCLKRSYDAAVEMADNETYEVLALVAPGKLYAGAETINTDTGKTHLAIGICQRWLERGRAARYAYVPRLGDELRASYGDNTYSNLFDFFVDVPLLVLDDLGVEKDKSGWLTEKLDTIVHEREINGRAMVITSNLSLATIAERVSYRIASRIKRCDKGIVIEVDAPEYSSVRM